MVEFHGQKSLERAVSQRTIQIRNSFPCQFCVVGFLCGVCLTSLFLAFYTSIQFGGGFSISAFSTVVSNPNSRFMGILKWGEECDSEIKRRDLSNEQTIEMQMWKLYSSWNSLLRSSSDIEKKLIPSTPHLVDCNTVVETNKKYDRRFTNHSLPPWRLWRGHSFPPTTNFNQASYPPWVEGSDEENYPLTRKVQRDIWIHQHPMNCRDPSVRFLIADWERLPGFGIGAQIAGMSGLFAIAINENRVLVTKFYNRADHDGCKGHSRSHWSCYFFLETSHECQDQAFNLMAKLGAWEKGIITKNGNYSSKEIWAGKIPRIWGTPWNYLQPTTEINGTLVTNHRRMDQRWWRAQALRYLMRFQTKYTCRLMNVERHAAFGMEAAKMIIENGLENPRYDKARKGISGMEEYVWSGHKPWIPRPLLSMHVRIGDKACEMDVVEFENYMLLANRIRTRFPHLRTIWLSTEMQSVVEKSKAYRDWKFYYTEVMRQEGNVAMASYEASLGRENSTNYPLVNLLMASEADFFVGALGSSWCFLIDGMRNTGGKVMAGYLSVNKDRFW